MKHDGHKAHPTQKPEALLYRVLLATTQKGDVVLDPFFGTGTTGAVAKRLGRRLDRLRAGGRSIATSRPRASRRSCRWTKARSKPCRAKRTAPKVAFGVLVENGLIAPGTQIFDKKRRWIATVRADGSLVHDKQVGSIHGLGKELQGAPSCNGWTFWHIEHGGKVEPIDAVRQLYLLATED